MKRPVTNLMGLWLALQIGSTLAALPGGDDFWYETQPPRKPSVKLYMFWSERCPHCRDALPFILDLSEKHSWIDLHSLEILGNAENRRLFVQMSELLRSEARSVPTFMWCGEQISGYGGPDTTGTHILNGLVACYTAVYGEAPPGVQEVQPSTQTVPPIKAPLVGTIDANALSLPALTLTMGALDSFNPCAFFVLLFLLSLLVHTRSRGKMLLVGGVFVFFSAVVYFVFMAAWLNVFKLLGQIQWVTAFAGLIAVSMAVVNIKDYFWFKQGISLSLTERQQSNLFQRARKLLHSDNLTMTLVGTVVLALAANSYELLCTAGFPMIYTRILTLNDLPESVYYLYLAFYNIVYIMPLLVIVLVFVATLGSRKLKESEGRILKLLSGVMMLSLGGLLLIAPQGLENMMTAVLLLGMSVAVTAAVLWLERARRGKSTA